MTRQTRWAVSDLGNILTSDLANMFTSALVNMLTSDSVNILLVVRPTSSSVSWPTYSPVIWSTCSLVNWRTCSPVPWLTWPDQHVHLLVRKIKEKIIWPKGSLVKLTGKHIRLESRIHLLVSNWNFLISNFFILEVFSSLKVLVIEIKKKSDKGLPEKLLKEEISFKENKIKQFLPQLNNLKKENFFYFYHMCIHFLISKNRILQRSKRH